MAIWLVLFSCKKDKPNTTNTPLPTDSTTRVLLVCEGSLGNGNATIGAYFPVTDSVYHHLYKTANTTDLGDVFQSVTKVNSHYFLCINNTDKIIVIDTATWLQKANINVPKPRYLLHVGNNRAYVGSLFNNKIFIVNTQNYSVLKSIEMPFQNVEGMILKDGFVYACCWDTACRQLYKIDISQDRIIDSIALMAAAPQSILLDKNKNAWIMGGNAYKSKSSSLHCIELNSKKINKFFPFAAGIEAIKPVSNHTADSLFFLEVNYNGGSSNNGVFVMPINSSALPTSPIISCTSFQYFWALGIHPISQELYVGDPKGFVQSSTVGIYSKSGILRKQFKTGVGIGAFYFD
ncbi:MAG: hypothetical protein IT256_08760 [Chitinophagaceae bacterium]|nr:hypothetical protein [Chitinophagaceae bacterium]